MDKGSKKPDSSFLLKIKKAELPGFNGAPLDTVVHFVLKGFGRGALVTRASSIAFNMLMAVLPAFIFLFTLIPFIPVENFQSDLVRVFENLMPSNLYSVFENTIVEVITQKSGTLLIFMFFATIVFSTNGIHALMHAFNTSTHGFTSRNWFQQRKIAVVMLFIILILFSFSGMLIILSKSVVKKLIAVGLLRMSFIFYLVMILKWVLIIITLFLAISTLYYFVPAKKKEFRYFSPGSLLATILFIITSLGFSAYVNNFGQYNKLYGSIGTLIVMMVWLYLNSIALLMGFELNASIKSAAEELETIA
jgi:membrane protein